MKDFAEITKPLTPRLTEDAVIGVKDPEYIKHF